MRQLHAHVINMTNTIYSQGELAVLNAHKGLPLIFYLLLKSWISGSLFSIVLCWEYNSWTSFLNVLVLILFLVLL